MAVSMQYCCVRTLLVVLCSLGVLVPKGAQAAAARAPLSFAVLVDTSGSMVGYYERRDPRPTLVLELVESLVTETMSPGDHLVVMPFDHEVRDEPGSFVALSSLSHKTALREIEKLGLNPRSGRGTVRSAAMGRATRALEGISGEGAEGAGGIIYIVTDRDTDQKPEPGQALDSYNLAQSLQNSRRLTLLSRISQGGLMLEVWRWAGPQGAPGVPQTSTTVAQVKKLLKQIIPERPMTSGPVAADLESGGLTLRLLSERWQPDGKHRGHYRMPAELVSSYRALHFRGKVDPRFSFTTKKGAEFAGASGSLRLPADVRLAPDDRVRCMIEFKGPSPGVLSLAGQALVARAEPLAAGTLTTDPKVLEAPDPATTAKITGAVWLSPIEISVRRAPSVLPPLPATGPPRFLQFVILLAIASISVIAWRAFGPKPVPPLSVYHWAEGTPSAVLTLLAGKATSAPLEGVNARVRREIGKTGVDVTAAEGARLLNASMEEKEAIHFEKGGVFILEGLDKRPTAVSVGIGTPAGPPDPARPRDILAEPDESADNGGPDDTGEGGDWNFGSSGN